ncbi:hypothetical protein SAMN06265368_0895 [Cohaesibacter gelatinilyticus]|uniref:Uncharacterized protein n=1 Tax=Cohaesibacter gelatinilyticus TaxID=372072 RepID=A0A285NHM4_9HYPH|nr:hypothetical protein SAMN06265368_0895 [Cohaesibacter gelatinilyticus]
MVGRANRQKQDFYLITGTLAQSALGSYLKIAKKILFIAQFQENEPPQ